MHIGERISSLRNRDSISQSELARIIGATRAAVNAWEMGLSNPNMMSLLELSKYFHVSVDYLLGLDNREMISVEELYPDEKKMILKLINHFEYLHQMIRQ